MPNSIYADYQAKYTQQTMAEALFFHSSIYSNVKGLRLLLPDKGLEFSDNSYVGTGAFQSICEDLTAHCSCKYRQDPAGRFFYDDIEKVKTANRYVSDNTTNPKNGQLIAWVKFYKDNTLVGEVCQCHISFKKTS